MTRRPPGAVRSPPSSWNGVTTAMIGNCGVGFAPCRPDQRGTLVEFMEGVEDIPGAVLDEGLPWTWQSFEQYMDALDARPYDRRHRGPGAAFAGPRFRHGPAGRGARAPPAPKTTRAMAEIAAAGIRAGALGFSTLAHAQPQDAGRPPDPDVDGDRGRAERHRCRDGHGRCRLAAGDLRLPRSRRGVRHAAPRGSSAAGGRSPSPSSRTTARRMAGAASLAHIAEANRAGLPMIGQTLTRATGVLLGFEISINPFSGRPSWDADRPSAANGEIGDSCGSRSSAPASLPRKCADARSSPSASCAGTGSTRSARRRITSPRPSRASPPSPPARDAGLEDVALRLLAGARREGDALPAGQQLQRGLRSTPWARCCGIRTRWSASATAVPTWACCATQARLLTC